MAVTGLLNCDPNDRTATDPYDANGNLLNGGVGTNVYDFENRLVSAGGVQIVYDGDGNRVQETAAGATTRYLTAEVNPTGYVQVLGELSGTNALQIGYLWGLQLIAQRTFVPGGGVSYYGFDGHGSVRYITSSTGALLNTYDYDAFGNLLNSTGTLFNNYLFAGEQFDPALGVYYNRARYYDQRQGRFWTMDTYEGDPESPASLHKYLYVKADPVNEADRSGHATIAEEEVTTADNEVIEAGLQQTLRATEYLDNALQAAVVLASTSVAAMLLLATTELINNRTKNDDGRRRRGRIGIQGNDLARQSKRFNQVPDSLKSSFPDLLNGSTFSFSGDTLAWGWTRTWPVLKVEGLAALKGMEGQLGATQLECRKTAFIQAERAIQTPGGLPQGFDRDYQGESYSRCDGTERIDIHIFEGSAFEK